MIRRKPIRRGVTIVETALVLPICFVLMLGLFDFCRLLMMRQVLDNAARDGARFATVSTASASTSDVQTVVQNFLAGQLSSSSTTTQVYLVDPATGANLGDWTTATLGQAIAVQITANYQPLLSKFSLLPNTVTINATVIMRSEAN